jgi:hypothetical protein
MFMLVHLFQQNRTFALALTMDVTGRNLPSRMAARNWVFLETLDTNNRRNIAEIDDVLSRVKAFGYYIL